MLRNKINEENMRMFDEEIQLMIGLRHPNIVQVTGLRRGKDERISEEEELVFIHGCSNG